MARHKDTNWNLLEGGEDGHRASQIYMALLMDIRDELKQLNRVFACPNFVGMPHTLNKIRIAVGRKNPTPKGKI